MEFNVLLNKWVKIMKELDSYWLEDIYVSKAHEHIEFNVSD